MILPRQVRRRGKRTRYSCRRLSVRTSNHSATGLSGSHSASQAQFRRMRLLYPIRVTKSTQKNANGDGKACARVAQGADHASAGAQAGHFSAVMAAASAPTNSSSRARPWRRSVSDSSDFMVVTSRSPWNTSAL
jgi:hypothetical protein